MGEQVLFESLSLDAQAAFEERFPTPAGANKPFVVKSGGLPPAVVQLLLDHSTWIALAGLYAIKWIGDRAGTAVDEFIKGFTGEAGKSTWTALQSLVKHFGQEQPDASTTATNIEAARQAAQAVEQRPVTLNLGSPLNKEGSYVYVSTLSELSVEQTILAFQMMEENIVKCSNVLEAQRSILFGQIKCSIQPFGYRLAWIEDPWEKMQQDFFPNGQSKESPTKQKKEDSEDVERMRNYVLETLPDEMKSVAIEVWRKHDAEKL